MENRNHITTTNRTARARAHLLCRFVTSRDKWTRSIMSAGRRGGQNRTGQTWWWNTAQNEADCARNMQKRRGWQMGTRNAGLSVNNRPGTSASGRTAARRLNRLYIDATDKLWRTELWKQKGNHMSSCALHLATSAQWRLTGGLEGILSELPRAILIIFTHQHKR